MRASHWQQPWRRLCFCHMTQAPPPPALDWCLFLDVDGTLVELTDTPSQTAADPEIKSLLRDVAERLGGAVALVSGRKIETLDELFAPLKLPAAGLHGVEEPGLSESGHHALFGERRNRLLGVPHIEDLYFTCRELGGGMQE